MEVHLLRHTKVSNINHLCYGQSDIPLADSFLQEVAIVKTSLDSNYDKVYASPLARCTALAVELGYHDHEQNDAVKEVNFGNWEGLAWNKIPSSELNIWMNDFVNIAPPQGETLKDMHQRVIKFIEQLRTMNYHKVLIITHSGVIRNIVGYVLGMPLENIFKIEIGYGSMIKVKLGNNRLSDILLLDIKLI
jgi:alpha-ribazole phosphatase